MMETTGKQRAKAGTGRIMRRVLDTNSHMQAFLGHHTMGLRGIGMYNTGVKGGYSNSNSLAHNIKTGTSLTLLSLVRK